MGIMIWPIVVSILALLRTCTPGPHPFPCYDCIYDYPDTSPLNATFDKNKCAHPVSRQAPSWMTDCLDLCVSALRYNKERGNMKEIVRTCSSRNYTVSPGMREAIRTKLTPTDASYCFDETDPNNPSFFRICFCVTDKCNIRNWETLTTTHLVGKITETGEVITSATEETSTVTDTGASEWPEVNHILSAIILLLHSLLLVRF